MPRILLLLVLYAARLSDGPPPPWSAPAQVVTEVQVTLAEFTLSPAQVTVPQGRPVTFTVTNAGSAAHNLALQHDAGSPPEVLFDPDLQPGETRTAEFTFRSAGAWRMYDPLDGYAQRGMEGLVAILAHGDGGAAAPAVAGCTFRLGFAALHDLIPEIVGDCVTDETHNPANGNALQYTTRGLLVWRAADNWTAFTDGTSTWINGPCGLQSRLNSDVFPWETGGGCEAAEPALVGGR
jgi:plastocyanin